MTVTTGCRSRQTLLVRPEAPESGTLVSPGDPTSVSLMVRNAAPEWRTVQIACCQYTGAPTTPGPTVSLSLGPDDSQHVPVTLSVLPAGLHGFDCAVSRADGELEGYQKRFRELGEKYRKPVTSCLISDAVATGRPDDPWLLWPHLDAGLKLARYCPTRKSCYDLLSYPSYKGLPPVAIFQLLDTAAGTKGVVLRDADLRRPGQRAGA